MLSQRTVVVVFLSLLISYSPLAQQRQGRQSAWDALIQENPTIVDDPQVGWKDRLILYALSPEQAQDYYRGAHPSTIMLENGETLQQYLDQRMAPAGNLYFPLPTPCSLFSLEGETSGEPLALRARGEDLSQQGGSTSGCGIPEEATALMIQLRMESPARVPVRVKLWSMVGPEPSGTVIDSLDGQTDSTMVVVPIVRPDYLLEGEFLVSNSDWSMLEGQVVGYFEIPADLLNGRGVSFVTETSALTAAGDGALANNSVSGIDNSAFGVNALNLNTTGDRNTAVGKNALSVNVTGNRNTAVGTDALATASSSDNTAVGEEALALNSTGSSNTAVGKGVLKSNALGSYNTAIGLEAGMNATGSYNLFVGIHAGYGGTSGFNNTGDGNSFFGFQAGYSNTTGYFNVFSGESAGYYNTAGWANTFFGRSAGSNNTVEKHNTMIGYFANFNPGADPDNFPVVNATAIGYRAYVSRSNSLVLGSINGINAATDYVNVGIGTAAPSAPLHVARSNGKAQLLIEETSGTTAIRTLLELRNNGANRFVFTNTNSGGGWLFASNTADDFSFSRMGTGGSEFILTKNGRLLIGPGPGVVFDLLPDGNLGIAGDLTANGVVYTSDREKKENFIDIDPQQILDKLVRIPITEWNFKQDNTRHIGPMAQDFYAAFGVGKDDKHLNPVDTSGVNTVAIQGLYQQNVEMKTELKDKDREIESLKTRLVKLEKLMTTINWNNTSSDDD